MPPTSRRRLGRLPRSPRLTCSASDCIGPRPGRRKPPRLLFSACHASRSRQCFRNRTLRWRQRKAVACHSTEGRAWFSGPFSRVDRQVRQLASRPADLAKLSSANRLPGALLCKLLCSQVSVIPGERGFSAVFCYASCYAGCYARCLLHACITNVASAGAGAGVGAGPSAGI